MEYNVTFPAEDNIVLPSVLFKYYPTFNIPNYTAEDLNVIRKYLLFCCMLYHIGIVFNNTVFATTYYKCILIYNIFYRYMYSIDPYTSVKNILTGLFLFDMFEIMFYKIYYRIRYENKPTKKTDLILLYHHIAILMIYIFEPHTDLTHAVVYGEIGNIPLNIEYCMIKHRSSFSSFKLNELTIINIFKRMNEINVITYIIVRIFFYTYFMLFLDFSCYSTYYAFIPLYMMGIGWSNQLIKQWQRHHIELDNKVD